MARSNKVANNTAAAPKADADAEIRRIQEKMIDAWNRRNGESFAASFADDALQIAFDGSYLKGRKEIGPFHQELFDTTLTGSRLSGQVDNVRFITPDIAVMTASTSVIMPGSTEPLESRSSMQLFVVQRENGKWQTKELLDARRITIERQRLLDDFETLPDDSKRRVLALIRALKY